MELRFAGLAVAFVLSLAIRCAYEILKERQKIDPESKLIFGLILTVMCALWVSWFSLCPLDPFHVGLPGPVRWIGLVLFIVGMVLALGALFQLRGVENIKHLVTSGLFAKIRHPMYLGFTCWIVGWSIYHAAFLSLAIGAPGIASILWWRHLEDRRLERQFGIEYRRYRQQTWF
jgi:protein-S-isoprenylcysteine O-methyltransferase Ste14